MLGHSAVSICIPKVLQHFSLGISHFPEGLSKGVTDTLLLFPVLQLCSVKRPMAIRVNAEPFQQPERALHWELSWLDLLAIQSKLFDCLWSQCQNYPRDLVPPSTGSCTVTRTSVSWKCTIDLTLILNTIWDRCLNRTRAVHTCEWSGNKAACPCGWSMLGRN